MYVFKVTTRGIQSKIFGQFILEKIQLSDNFEEKINKSEKNRWQLWLK